MYANLSQSFNPWQLLKIPFFFIFFQLASSVIEGHWMWDYREGVFKDTQWSINVFQHGNGSTTARISNVICFLYNLHDGSHFKPIQKWASKKIWRRFPSSFKRICHAIFSQMSPQFLCRKNFSLEKIETVLWIMKKHFSLYCGLISKMQKVWNEAWLWKSWL